MLARTNTDTSPAVDSTSGGAGGGTRSTADNSPAVDTASRTTRLPRAVFSAAPATDTTSHVPGLARTQADSAAAADTQTRHLTESRTVGNTAAATDVSQRAAQTSRATAGAAPASDTDVGTVSRTTTTTDTAPADDDTTRGLVLPRALYEDVSVVDTLLVGAPVVVHDPEASLAVNLHRARLTHNEHYAVLARNQRTGVIMDTYVQGDLLPDLTCVLYDGNTPFDATGATSVVVKVWVNEVLLLSRPADTVSTDGTVTLAWQAGETDNPGPFKVRVVVTYGIQPTTFPANGYMVGTIYPAAP
jgi:hypothetical protein